MEKLSSLLLMVSSDTMTSSSNLTDIKHRWMYSVFGKLDLKSASSAIAY